MTTMKIDNRFKKKLRGRYERLEFEAGILKDGRHLSATPASKGLGRLQGGPVRRKSSKSYTSLSQVGERIRKQHGVDYLNDPFKKTNSNLFKKFIREMGLLLTGKTRAPSRTETALRSLIRTPILKGAYGRNTRKTARVKTFNRFLIDTGQFWRNITAKVRSKRV